MILYKISGSLFFWPYAIQLPYFNAYNVRVIQFLQAMGPTTHYVCRARNNLPMLRSSKSLEGTVFSVVCSQINTNKDCKQTNNCWLFSFSRAYDSLYCNNLSTFASVKEILEGLIPSNHLCFF